MEQDFDDIVNSISDIELPKGLKQAVFQRLEKEKMKKVAREKLYFRIGFVVSGISSIAAGIFLGKEILSSEFFSLATLVFSDVQTVAAMWQDYTLSLLETLPTVSVAVTLLPIFVFMLLLKQYGKLAQYNQIYLLKN